MTGWFEGTVDFGAGPLVSEGAIDVFVLKLDPAGHAIWSRRFGSGYGGAGTKIALDASGNILLGGTYGGVLFPNVVDRVDFGGGPLPWIWDFSYNGVFLVRLDPDGNHLWSQGYLRSGIAARWVHLRGIAADAAGNSAGLFVYPGDPDDSPSPVYAAVFRSSGAARLRARPPRYEA